MNIKFIYSFYCTLLYRPGGEPLSDLRRKSLLKSGEYLFSKMGFRDVTVKDITASAGLASGTFYNYFSDKEQFYSLVISLLEDRAISEAQRIIGRFESPMNQLKALYRFITLALPKNPIMKGILTGDKKFFRSNILIDKNIESIRNSIGSLINDIIASGTRKPTFKLGSYHDINKLLITLHKVLLLELDVSESEQLVQDVLVLLERGLGRRLPLRYRSVRQDRRRNKSVFN